MVSDRFVTVYENGVTPNPFIDYNCFMKFDKLCLRARKSGDGNVSFVMILLDA